MRAKRTRVFMALIVVLALAAIPWAMSAWRRHQNILACRKVYAELVVQRPNFTLPGTLAADGSDDDRFSVPELVRTIERQLEEPFVINRACRDPQVRDVLGNGKVSADSLAELIHTSADAGKNSAFVRVWIEGDLDPKDAAQLTNAVVDACVTGFVDDWDKDRKEELAQFKVAREREGAQRAELKDQIQALTRRTESARRASQSHAIRSQQALVEKLDELLIDFKSQRILLLADQSASDDEAGQSTGAVRTSLVKGPSADTADPPDDESAHNSSFKRRLAKLDRKIEFFKRSIEELELEPNGLSAFERDQAELRDELKSSDARMKSLEDAIRLRELKLEYEHPPVRRHLDAMAPST